MSSRLNKMVEERISSTRALRDGNLPADEIDERKRMIEERMAREPAGVPVPLPEIDASTMEKPEEFQAAIQQLNDAHTKAVEALGEQLKSAIGQIITTQAHVEEVERQKNEKSTAGRLSDVLQVMAEQKLEDIALANAGESAEAKALKEEEDRLNARVQPALAKADEAFAAAHKWASTYKSALEELHAKKQEEWLQGQPWTTSAEQQRSVGLVAQLVNYLRMTLALYEGFLATNNRCRAEIKSLVTTGRFRLNEQELRRALNQAIHELEMGVSMDTVNTLEANTRCVTATLETLAQRKAAVKGEVQPEIEFDSKKAIVTDAQRAEEMTAIGDEHGRPTTAVTNDGWNGIAGGRA